MYTVFNENWLAQNENRAYPLAFDAQAEDVTGSFAIPQSLLLAMQMSVPALDAIDPAKDVDGFHPVNVGRLSLGLPALEPCTPRGCVMLAKRSGASLAGMHAPHLLLKYHLLALEFQECVLKDSKK